MASVIPGEPGQLTLLPTQTGDVRNLSQPGFNYDFAEWLPDGKRLLVIGNETGKPSRNYLQDAAGASLKTTDDDIADRILDSRLGENGFDRLEVGYYTLLKLWLAAR